MAFTATITDVRAGFGQIQVTLSVTDGTTTVAIPFAVENKLTAAEIKAYLLTQKAFIIEVATSIARLQSLVGQSVP